jgi:hypothetical protein
MRPPPAEEDWPEALQESKYQLTSTFMHFYDIELYEGSTRGLLFASKNATIGDHLPWLNEVRFRCIPICLLLTPCDANCYTGFWKMMCISHCIYCRPA